MGEFVRFESDGPVRHIVLNAPQRLNALDRPMLAELAEAVRAVAADEDARAWWLVVRVGRFARALMLPVCLEIPRVHLR